MLCAMLAMPILVLARAMPMVLMKSVNGGAKTGHRAEQKSANLGVEGALAAALPI